jgi:hypothetical protein
VVTVPLPLLPVVAAEDPLDEDESVDPCVDDSDESDDALDELVEVLESVELIEELDELDAVVLAVLPEYEAAAA